MNHPHVEKGLMTQTQQKHRATRGFYEDRNGNMMMITGGLWLSATFLLCFVREVDVERGCWIWMGLEEYVRELQSFVICGNFRGQWG